MPQIREDKEMLQRLFDTLGQHVFSLLPQQWSKVVIGYFLVGEKKSTHQQIWYLPHHADDYVDLLEVSWDKPEYDEGVLAVRKACSDILALCEQSGDHWQEMTVTLSAYGDFTVDYRYATIPQYDADFILTWQSLYLC